MTPCLAAQAASSISGKSHMLGGMATLAAFNAALTAARVVFFD